MAASQLLFVFLSPERLGIYEFREQLKNMEELHIYFAYGVIDEVHCVSEWGHDFRFTYLHLGKNLYKYVKAKDGEISLFGLTATASFDVLADVERELSAEGAFNLDADTIVRFENTNRLELQFKIEKVEVQFEYDKYFDQYNSLKPGLPKAVRFSDNKAFQQAKKKFIKKNLNKIPKYFNELQEKDALKIIIKKYNERQDTIETQESNLYIEMPEDFCHKKDNFQQAGIIFCPHKANTDIAVKTISDELALVVDEVGTFIGGDDPSTSMKNLELFRDNKLPIMVATKAFGMGIDKPNVRFTVNMNYSSSLEGFVQEAGRAGRDRSLALSLILFSYYKLVRINKKYPSETIPFKTIKNKWFYPEDLRLILNHYGVEVDSKYLDYCTPEQDIVQIHCETDHKTFAFNKCSSECKKVQNCILAKIPKELKGWQYEKDLLESIKNFDVKIDKKYIQYQNSDYEAMIYFYNGSFKGAGIELQFMENLLNIYNVKVSNVDEVEIPNNLIESKGFLTLLLDQREGDKVVSFVNYTKSDKENDIESDDVDIAKAIYRMSCIGLIEDFTQDYGKNRYRIVAKRKGEGEYFEGLKKFLLRYFNEDRANLEIEKARNYPLSLETENQIRNEIFRSLAYLTEFVYEKISVKRKRAIDDMRNFCLIGLEEGKDWKELNEELKDFIYYYFNSKYARSGYQTENGQPYSLTDDTDNGKESSSKVLFKFLKINDPDVIGLSTPIDNVKHLQGALRLIRRSLTDKNPCLSLLNAYCLYFLGTRNNANLENELLTSYKEGMEEFAVRIEDPSDFWKLFDQYNEIISQFANKKQFTKLQNEVMLSIHSQKLNKITERFLQ